MKSLLIVLVAAILAGCATPASVEQMAVALPTQQTNAALKNSVGVADVTGGSETNPMWTSQVSGDSFSRLLKYSLRTRSAVEHIVDFQDFHFTF